MNLLQYFTKHTYKLHEKHVHIYLHPFSKITSSVLLEFPCLKSRDFSCITSFLQAKYGLLNPIQEIKNEWLSKAETDPNSCHL